MKRAKIKKILDADKIAAGEVVDRPANVVKELIENSIDADAQEIRIVIKKAGKNLIQVIDDGMGIPPKEIEIAFERYTSSKIRSIHDLDNLSTLGFRGEALASIAAVSQIEITSKTKENEFGTQLIIDGGKIAKKKEVTCPNGTNIVVKNLFYNIPARKKFFKSDSTELGHITDIIQRYSLSSSHLHFIYVHNDITILNCPSLTDLKTTVFHIYGKKTARYMEPVSYKEKGNSFKIYGLIGHRAVSKKSRNYSSLFINNRYIISDLVFRAIKEAYNDILMVGMHPFFVLFIELDPSIIDFNVHPKKLNIRFENDDFLFNKVFNVIRGFVKEKFIKNEAKYLSTELYDFVSKKEKLVGSDDYIKTDEIAKPKKPRRDYGSNVEKSLSVGLGEEKLEYMKDKVQLSLSNRDEESQIEKKQLPEEYIRGKHVISENFPKIRLISYTGQFSNKTYIVLEGISENGEPGMFLLDQHAASERIKKEIFENMYQSSKMNKQRLIVPLKIEVSPSEKFFLEENLSEVRKIGFSFDYFGGNTFILREIPTIFEKALEINLIKDIITDITELGKGKSFFEVKEEIINYLACHKSIRGGDDLTLADIRNLINNLAKCKNPFHCAHGRPTLRFLSFKDLDKIFKRTG